MSNSTSFHGRRSLSTMRLLSRWSTCGLAVLALFAPAAGPTANADEAPTKKQERTRSGRMFLADLQDAFSSVADELEPAVVTLYTSHAVRKGAPDGEGDPLNGLMPFARKGQKRSNSTGSGVIISKDGWVLTNDHVVSGADKILVRLHDGREFLGAVRRDARSDLALVKITNATSFPVARLGDSDNLRIGHWAIAVGSPYRYEGSFSVGVISSLYRSQKILDFGAATRNRFYPNMIQTDAAINPGNSGGPLCNLDGEVIGINTAIESENGGSVGIGFAIPINAAKFVIAQLKDSGKVHYGYLGVSPVSVTPRVASALNVLQGALIDTEPEIGTPAATAGIHAGDVVTAINGKLVKNELDLRTVVAQTRPKTAINITLSRDGSEKTVKAVLEDAPDLESVSDAPKPAAKPRLGIDVEPLTEKLAQQIGVSPKARGVAIKAIDPDSPAADNTDLMEGQMIIIKLNNTETPTVAAFQEAAAKLKAGDSARILIQVGKLIRFTIVPID